VLIAQAQEALHTWEGTLRATGGALEPSKSYWYLHEVVRKNGKWAYSSEAESPGDIYPHNKGVPFKVPRLSVHTAKEALGVHTDGKMYDQVKYLCKKTENGDAVRPRVNAYDAWYCLNSTT
jgi:hypothetical protein